MSAYATALKRLFTDRMTLWRGASRIDGDGATLLFWEEAPLAAEVPCRLSYRGRSFAPGSDEPKPGRGENPVAMQPMIICAPDAPVRSGDYVAVTRCVGGVKTTVKGWAGAPMLYAGSMQFRLAGKEAS